jgi:hypothetical protein
MIFRDIFSNRYWISQIRYSKVNAGSGDLTDVFDIPGQNEGERIYGSQF